MFNFIKKQFIDVIQWSNPDDSLLMWRFPIADEEIQNGASLTVREAQMAMFVDEGVTADVFGPGRYTLNTQTLPVLTNLKNWDKLFESPFKSDVYFFNTKQQLARKWGTSQPVTVRDAEFGAVQLRSFGMYSYRISPFLDMAANQVLLSQKIGELLGAEFTKLGLALENFTVESITLPASIQAALDKKISMGVIGDLGRYTQYQTAESIPLAAQSEGGLAGIGAGLGVGAGIGQAMAGAMSGMMQPNVQQAQQNVQPAAEDPQAKLMKLKSLLDGGLISQEDFDKAKAEVLKQLIG